ncbi:MAG: high frequency lysogenization protein HflD [Gammaproteobacteria bacterium]
MSHSSEERIIALAGAFQATHLVQQIAHTGTMDTGDFEVCINSIFNINPPTTAAVYGGVRGISTGLKRLRTQLGGGSEPRNMEITRYIVAVLYLERQMAKNSQMLQQIAEGIEKARGQAQHFSQTHSNVIASLAGLYSDTISTLNPRIIVSGEQGYLSNPDNANKVRALLLAAIRSAVLWRQCGGGRWQLLFGRSRMVREAGELLGET